MNEDDLLQKLHSRTNFIKLCMVFIVLLFLLCLAAVMYGHQTARSCDSASLDSLRARISSLEGELQGLRSDYTVCSSAREGLVAQVSELQHSARGFGADTMGTDADVSVILDRCHSGMIENSAAFFSCHTLQRAVDFGLQRASPLLSNARSDCQEESARAKDLCDQQLARCRATNERLSSVNSDIHSEKLSAMSHEMRNLEAANDALSKTVVDLQQKLLFVAPSYNESTAPVTTTTTTTTVYHPSSGTSGLASLFSYLVPSLWTLTILVFAFVSDFLVLECCHSFNTVYKYVVFAMLLLYALSNWSIVALALAFYFPSAYRTSLS